MSHDSEGPIDETGVLDHLFGVWYPTRHLVGVIEDRSSADAADYGPLAVTDLRTEADEHSA